MWPALETRSSVGFRPKMPQQCAGTRIEPPMSLPMSSGASPAATAAAAPPLEPPGVRARSHGLFVRPKTGLSVCRSASSSETFVLPRTIAPACRIRRATVPSRSGT